MRETILISAYFNDNLGDDLFVKVMAEAKADKQFICLIPPHIKKSSLPQLENVEYVVYSRVKRRLDRISHKYFQWMPFLKSILKRADQTVILGGSLFIEGDFSPDNIFTHKQLLKYSKELSIVGANFGPYKSDGFYNEYKEFFSKLKKVSFRDEYSKSLFIELDNVQQAPDFVLNLPIKPEEKKKKKVAISAIDLKRREDIRNCNEKYLMTLNNITESFASKGYEVVYLSFCKNEGDLEVCNQLKAMTDQQKVRVLNYSGNIDEFLKEINESEYIVATRFHSMILGWLCHVKTLPIIYSDKTLNVIQDFGYTGNYIDLREFKELDMEHLESNFATLEDVERYIKEAQNHFSFFNECSK